MHSPLMGSSLVVPARYLVRNVTVAYARWWHTIVGATCWAEHMLGVVLAPKRKAGPQDPPLFGESLSQRKKKRGGRKFRGKKGGPASPFGNVEFGVYFEEIGLGAKETMTESQVAPSSRQRKETPRFDRRIAYKYPQDRRFITDLMRTHTPRELQDLLAAGVEFPELGW